MRTRLTSAVSLTLLGALALGSANAEATPGVNGPGLNGGYWIVGGGVGVGSIALFWLGRFGEKQIAYACIRSYRWRISKP